jgi:hypothetical protein
LRLVVECSEAPDCFLCRGTVSLEVDIDCSERALLNEASLLDVAEEEDLETSVAPSPLVFILLVDSRGLVRVTIEGACKDFTEFAEDERVREGVDRPATCESLGESNFLLTVLRASPDRALFVRVDTVDEEVVLDTDLTELADEVRRLRTEGTAVAGLATFLCRRPDFNELVTLEVSSSFPLRLLGGVCLTGDSVLVIGTVVLYRSSTGTSISVPIINIQMTLAKKSNTVADLF